MCVIPVVYEGIIGKLFIKNDRAVVVDELGGETTVEHYKPIEVRRVDAPRLEALVGRCRGIDYRIVEVD